MKKLLLFSLLLFLFKTVNAQSIYYESILLSKLKKTATKKIQLTNEVKELLQQYYPTGKTIDTTLLNKNPFFKNLFFIPAAAGADKSSFDKIISSSIGNLDVTNISQAMADFLIDRGKEELNVAFFNRMKIFLKEKEECRILFPSTVTELEKIDPSQYAEFIKNLRIAFKDDLNKLVINLSQVIELPKYEPILNKSPEIRFAARSAKIISELSQSENSITADSVIHLLTTLNTWDKNSNLGNSFKFLNIISQSLRYKDNTRIWLPMNDINILWKDPIARSIFLGLIYEQTKTIEFTIHGNKITVEDFMKSNSHNTLKLLSIFDNFILLANEVDQSIHESKNKMSEKKLSNEDYYDYINKSINVINYGFNISNIIKPNIIDDKYIIIARNSNDLYKNIYSKHYSSAINNVYNILEQITNEQRTLIAEDIKKQKKENNETKKNILTSNGVKNILKYGTLMAKIVEANSSEELQQAIESSVLPSGSSSIKKNTSWNLAINSYIGYSIGPRVNKQLSDAWNNNRGVTAPIGITLSKSLGKAKNFNLGSISGFATLLNIGSIVNYRLNNDSTAIKQEIKLENIFSPGGYLVYGFFANLPISIGYGAQYGPRLFKVESDKLGLTDKPGWRRNWFFSIDIPLFNLYSKSKTK